ncbi:MULTISPECIES: aromatic acid exporter family protein [unclassified Saccharopolyspora]|uniref:FUSC family protein n=1 Tax=unclassified Saccharopolyspora TaxID=2646250 RepID=UPI001CD60882|nr:MULTISPECIES: FUSC family protein [unclassified Saccharopolyspora]MCA1186321.1 FUSC family protein [Saccharopolyspora sp. 6T]MCA1192160.1 FUSC family protein [Saccharopolyspora sp. 6V]MCA1225817.1 FUSC family protein [Saccharopolyspora sp. 6M]MCA1279984.1 FUSC family protein [Saccharopolyspora sp. 7B]
MTSQEPGPGGAAGGPELLRRWLRSLSEHVRDHADTWLLLLKGVVAATLSWWIAAGALGAQAASFAPFSAVLLVHSTVSRSLNHSVRYLAAMVAGIVLAGVVITLGGAGIAVFALVVALALLIGQWRRLGSQGWQVAVAVMFAYQYFVQSEDQQASWAQLGALCGLVLLGSVVGVGTNLLLVPPLRYRSAEHGVRALSRSVANCLDEFAEAVDDGLPSRDRAQELWSRAQDLQGLAASARHGLDDAAETQRFNPRKLLAGAPRSFTGHHYTVNALTRVINELQSVARSLDTDDEAEDEPQRRWTSSFGELLSAVGEACRSLGEVHSAADLRDGGELADRVERARRCGAELAERRVAEGIDAATPWPIFRALTTDARRLVDDLISAHDDLKRLG